MVKIVLMNVAQASHALVPSQICVTTGNGHEVSSFVKTWKHLHLVILVQPQEVLLLRKAQPQR